LARPFLNVATGLQSSRVLASAGVASGAVAVQVPEQLQGAEGTLVWNVFRSPAFNFDVLAGFRYLDLGDSLVINDATITGAGTGSFTEDALSAHNHFFGGQVGGRVEYTWHSLVLSLTEKIALGGNAANIEIAGGPIQTTPLLPPGGLLAQPSNFGKHSDSSFAVVNEVGIQLGWRVCDYVQLFAGYTFLYDSSVVRIGNVVNVGVNPTQGIGLVRPAFSRQETEFWAHGANAGFEIRY
jgi:putative beta barrel porin BBP7